MKKILNILKKIIFWVLAVFSIIFLITLFTLKDTETEIIIITSLLVIVPWLIYIIVKFKKKPKALTKEIKEEKIISDIKVVKEPKVEKPKEKELKEKSNIEHNIIFNIFRVIFVATLALLPFIVGAVIYFKLIDNSAIDYSDAKTVQIETLYEEVKSNKARAIDKYENKVFKITGIIDNIGESYITIATLDNIYAVDFYYDKSFKEQVFKLEDGFYITVAGKLKEGTFGKWKITNGSIVEVH